MRQDSGLVSSCIYLKSPAAVISEICFLFTSIYPKHPTDFLIATFSDICSLFDGKYPGYKKCNTEYHDLKHTTDVLLSAARLIYGAHIDQVFVKPENAETALVATMFHDVGYIQDIDDNSGTGAKYTITHVERSASFLKKYCELNNLSLEFAKNCSDIILCTNIFNGFGKISFESEEIKFLGKIVATSDLIGQIADRNYLEKLIFLYHELKEGNIPNTTTELDLLKNTITFFNKMDERLNSELGGVYKYMKSHFQKRYGIDKDFYQEGLEKNISYLSFILSEHEKEYRKYLRRLKK